MSRPTLRLHKIIGGLLALALIVFAVVNAPSLGLLGTRAVVVFPAANARPKFAAVLFSGDMGFQTGMSGVVAKALAAHGVPVIGLSSPVIFARQRTEAQAQAIVTNAIRLALQRTGARRILLMGHSYGADILSTVAPHLPQDLRARIAAIDLAVPARDVYFRADPSGLAYLGKADAWSLPAMRTLKWAPVVCIYGVEESDSLCPALRGDGAQVIGLPGGHHLHHDHERLIAATFAALRNAVPGVGL